MTWFKVCDSMWSHPKTIGLSDAAVALWVRAGSYAGNHLTDGFVATHVLRILQGNDDTASELVEAGLWVEQECGYLFHDWNEYQPTRAKVHDERVKTRERVAAFRAKKSDSSISLPVPSRPDPTRPVLPVTNAVSNAVTPSVTKPDDRFDDFYSAYPLKKAKGAARKAWTTAVKKTDPQVIIDAASVYALSVAETDPQFVAHPATWLNAERWADEIVTRKPKRPDTAGDKRMSLYESLYENAKRREQGAISE